MQMQIFAKLSSAIKTLSAHHEMRHYTANNICEAAFTRCHLHEHQHERQIPHDKQQTHTTTQKRSATQRRSTQVPTNPPSVAT